MQLEAWIAIIGCVGALIGVVKYLTQKLSETSDKAIKAHEKHLDTFQKEIKEIKQNYYDTVVRLQELKSQLNHTDVVHKESISQIKKLIEATQSYIQLAEKRISSIEETLGKIIKVGK